MANINISRGGASLGVFPESEVREGLRSGRFLPSDLGWREGMSAWAALSTFSEFAADAAGTSGMPGVSPGSPPVLATIPGTAAIARTGLPWDRRGELGLVTAFFETLKLVLLQPSVAFASMKTEGGMGEPIIFALIGGCGGFLIYLLFSVLIQSFGIMANSHNPLAGMFGAGLGIVFSVIMIPFVIVLGIFLGSGLMHLCLMLVGGAKRSFETTLRVVCFTIGSTYPLLIVPVCGGLISGIWSLVCECIGLARAHETETGRAVAAVFLPLIVCCGGGFLCALMFGVAGAIFNH